MLDGAHFDARLAGESEDRTSCRDRFRFFRLVVRTKTSMTTRPLFLRKGILLQGQLAV